VEYLCTRVALINDGRIVAVGTPAELKKLTASENLEEAFIKLLSDVP
ncbi:MAG: multidrug ABC transporter ATP-binding protein, partial [Thermoprotei archaeon]